MGACRWLTGEEFSAQTAAATQDGPPGEAARMAFTIEVPPHPYRVFSTR